MTERHILIWIKQELVPLQLQAMDIVNKKHPGHIYTTDLLSAMTMRETGFLIARYVEAGLKPKDIHPIIRGDYGQREGEKEKSYHGYGYMQIDIASYPDFVKSGAWKDPVKTYVKALEVLEEKRAYLAPRFSQLQGEALLRAVVAAYNTGQGNVAKTLRGERKAKNRKIITDVDYTTHQKNYSKEVFRFRDIYNALPD
jgi:predicted metal-dependent hydrolase